MLPYNFNSVAFSYEYNCDILSLCMESTEEPSSISDQAGAMRIVWSCLSRGLIERVRTVTRPKGLNRQAVKRWDYRPGLNKPMHVTYTVEKTLGGAMFTRVNNFPEAKQGLTGLHGEYVGK